MGYEAQYGGLEGQTGGLEGRLLAGGLEDTLGLRVFTGGLKGQAQLGEGLGKQAGG